MKVVNRKARFNYEIKDTLEAGIVLTGPEVKSVKKGQISLNEAFVKIDDKQEAWLVNAHIHPYKFAKLTNYDPTRRRKLLLNKKQILSLQKKIEAANLTLVPLKCYTARGKIKIEVGIGKGKKTWQKKEKKKQQDLEREAERILKGM
jgi:SsrA-binding protein